MSAAHAQLVIQWLSSWPLRPLLGSCNQNSVYWGDRQKRQLAPIKLSPDRRASSRPAPQTSSAVLATVCSKVETPWHELPRRIGTSNYAALISSAYLVSSMWPAQMCANHAPTVKIDVRGFCPLVPIALACDGAVDAIGDQACGKANMLIMMLSCMHVAQATAGFSRDTYNAQRPQSVTMQPNRHITVQPTNTSPCSDRHYVADIYYSDACALRESVHARIKLSVCNLCVCQAQARS